MDILVGLTDLDGFKVLIKSLTSMIVTGVKKIESQLELSTVIFCSPSTDTTTDVFLFKLTTEEHFERG